jgi:hypothetical protein
VAGVVSERGGGTGGQGGGGVVGGEVVGRRGASHG